MKQPTNKAEEMYTLQKYFGTYETNVILGNLSSYKALREVHTFQDIFNEIKQLCQN